MAKAYPTILREGGGTLKKAARLFSTLHVPHIYLILYRDEETLAALLCTPRHHNCLYTRVHILINIFFHKIFLNKRVLVSSSS